VVAATAVATVVILPSLPYDLLRFDYFFGFTGPAIGLACLATLSIAALYSLSKQKPLGVPLSMAAGALLVLFELVESWVVGNVFFQPPGFIGAVYLALWLQPVYIGIGIGMILLGGRPESRSGKIANPPTALRRTLIGAPSRRTAIGLIATAIAAFGVYAWAASSLQSETFARMLAWGPGSTYAYSRFPSRPLPAATLPYAFPEAPIQVDLTAATGGSSADEYFASNESTAILVIQHGKLVLERYYNGVDRSTMLTCFSITKSWVSAMVGAAIAAGYIHSVDDPLTKYIPELSARDSRFSTITLHNLLAMRSGLAWNTNGLFNDDTVVWNTTALREAVLSRVRIAEKAGSTFLYNDFNPLLLGIVLERTTGRTVTQWLEDTLWNPLGAQYDGSVLIDSVEGGFEKMESGLTGRPIDILRLGVLYLDGGNWNGDQLIPNQWVEQTTDYASASPSLFDPNLLYAMGWWTRIVDGVQIFYAWGDHGEYVVVVPSLDMVVTRFGREYGATFPRGDAGGGTMGREVWPEVLARVATLVAGANP